MINKKKHRPETTLSPQALLFVNVIGARNVYPIVEKYGGEQFYLPKLKSFDTEEYRNKIKMGKAGKEVLFLVETVGLAATRRLCEIFGGARLYIPSVDRIRKFMRNLKIIEDFNGKNYDEVARKYGLSSKSVRKILNASRSGRRKIMRGRLRAKHRREQRRK